MYHYIVDTLEQQQKVLVNKMSEKKIILRLMAKEH